MESYIVHTAYNREEIKFKIGDRVSAKLLSHNALLKEVGTIKEIAEEGVALILFDHSGWRAVALRDVSHSLTCEETITLSLSSGPLRCQRAGEHARHEHKIRQQDRSILISWRKETPLP